MRVDDIAREIQKRGFRDLRTCKTPEAAGGRLPGFPVPHALRHVPGAAGQRARRASCELHSTGSLCICVCGAAGCLPAVAAACACWHVESRR